MCEYERVQCERIAARQFESQFVTLLSVELNNNDERTQKKYHSPFSEQQSEQMATAIGA